jgi:hypothetical protein
MIAHTIDLCVVQEIAIASALPKLAPAFAAEIDVVRSSAMIASFFNDADDVTRLDNAVNASSGGLCEQQVKAGVAPAATAG